MTLYRIDLKDPDVAFPRTIAWLIEMGVLVPVEPCEHGNINQHTICGADGEHEWCPGAGIGETP